MSQFICVIIDNFSESVFFEIIGNSSSPFSSPERMGALAPSLKIEKHRILAKYKMNASVGHETSGGSQLLLRLMPSAAPSGGTFQNSDEAIISNFRLLH